MRVLAFRKRLIRLIMKGEDRERNRSDKSERVQKIYFLK